MYIGRFKNGRYYVGISQQRVESLLKDHQSGTHCAYTKRHRLEEILWIEPSDSEIGARQRETQIKGWTHAKKLALVRGDMDNLKRLARSRHLRREL